MPEATYQDTPFDVLASRVRQVKGVLNAIQNTFDDNQYAMPASYMNEALWAVVELIDQAEAAVDAVCDEHLAERELRLKGGAK